MGYRDRVRSRIAVCRPADRAELRQFRQAMYGPASFLADDAYVDWSYGRDADGDPPLWIYRDPSDGHIAGQQGGLRTALRIDGVDHEAMWATELVVEPELHGRGVGAVLAEVARDAFPLRLAFKVTPLAQDAFARAGWTTLGTAPLYVRPLRVRAVLRRDGALGQALCAADALMRLADRALAVTHRAHRVEPVARFDDALVDELWQDCRDDYPVIARRDAATLNQRYADFPQPERYHLLGYRHRGQPAGVAVVRIEDRGGVVAAVLVDVLVRPHHARGLLSAVVDHARRLGVDGVWAIQTSRLLRPAFRRAGFVRRDTSWPLMVDAPALDPIAAARVRDAGNWFLTGGDSNVDRPNTGVEYAA